MREIGGIGEELAGHSGSAAANSDNNYRKLAGVAGGESRQYGIVAPITRVDIILTTYSSYR